MKQPEDKFTIDIFDEVRERDETYVLYKDHDGWFRVCHAFWWDDPTFKLDGQRVDTREEIQRFHDRVQARDLGHTYNMMVHRRPHN